MITNYATLVLSMKDKMNRSDLTDTLISNAVQAAESHFIREFKPPGLLTVVDPFTTTGRYTPLPSDYELMYRVTLLYQGQRRKLDFQAENLMDQYDSIHIGAAEGLAPRVYSIIGDRIQLAPYRDSDLELLYYRTWPSLETGASMAVAFVTKHPDLYEYRALVELATWLKDTKRRELYASLYETAEIGMKRHNKRARYGVAPTIKVA